MYSACMLSCCSDGIIIIINNNNNNKGIRLSPSPYAVGIKGPIVDQQVEEERPWNSCVIQFSNPLWITKATNSSIP